MLTNWLRMEFAWPSQWQALPAAIGRGFCDSLPMLAMTPLALFLIGIAGAVYWHRLNSQEPGESPTATGSQPDSGRLIVISCINAVLLTWPTAMLLGMLNQLTPDLFFPYQDFGWPHGTAAAPIITSPITIAPITISLTQTMTQTATPTSWTRCIEASLCIGSLLAGDFGYYWLHRAWHRYSVLWQWHAVHHSDAHLTALSYMRQHWIEPVQQVICVGLPLGFLIQHVTLQPTASQGLIQDTWLSQPVAWLSGSFILWQFIQHENWHSFKARLKTQPWVIALLSHPSLQNGIIRKVWRSLPVLIAMPAWHRLHHQTTRPAHDCNYGGIFAIFDWLFGTYQTPQPGESRPTGLSVAAQGWQMRWLFKS